MQPPVPPLNEMEEENGDARKVIELSRDTDAIMVPAGIGFILKEGTTVTMMQALGNGYTVLFAGNLAKIDSKDADALGEEPIDVFANLPKDASLEDRVWTIMRNCYDPEIPVNIVELGLIYRCDVIPSKDPDKELDGLCDVDIDMTLTTPGCGMGPVLATEIREWTLALPDVAECTVNIVFDPPWGYDNMSEVARLELGLL